MIYFLEGLSHITTEQLERATALVPPSRRDYAARYRFEKDRIQSIFAFLLLQYALRKEYAIETELRLNYSGGKPSICGLEHLQFNLSHCKLAAACAVSVAPVGVDVQDWEMRNLSVAKSVCCKEELAHLESNRTPQVEFAKLWTRKESYGKYTGKGITYPMKELCLLGQGPEGTVMETFALEGYALSYCAEEALKIHKVPLQALLQGREKD